MKVITNGMDRRKGIKGLNGATVRYKQIKHGRIRVTHGDLLDRFFVIAEAGTANFCLCAHQITISHIRQAPTACVYSSQSYGAYTCRSHLLKRVIKFRCDEGKKNPRFSLDWYRLKRGFDKRSASEANRLVIQRRTIRPIRNTHRDSLQNANKRNHVRFFTREHSCNINTKQK